MIHRRVNLSAGNARSFLHQISTSKENNQVATSSLPDRYLLSAFAAAAAIALFAGCSGSSSPVTPMGATQQNSGLTTHSPLGPAVKNHCPAHAGARVTPCTITFDASNTGPDTVSVRTQEDKKGTLTESDNCGGASGIATVTQGSGDDWTVTAGPTTGTCTATFDYNSKRGKLLGYANLSITNNL
jgi:hypothetical protein